MSLFNWGKKAPDKEEKPTPALPSEYEKRYQQLRERWREEMYSATTPTATTSTTGGTSRVPWSTAATAAMATAYSGIGASPHGKTLTLGDVYRETGIEPFAAIELLAHFAKLGIKTEADAKNLIKELEDV